MDCIKLMDTRDLLLGRELADWTGAIELVRVVANAVRKKMGEDPIPRKKIRKGKCIPVSDREVIRIFSDMANCAVIKPIADQHQKAVQSLNKAIDARNIMVHEIGEEAAKYLLQEIDVSAAVNAEIAIIERCSPDIQKNVKAINEFSIRFMHLANKS